MSGDKYTPAAAGWSQEAYADAATYLRRRAELIAPGLRTGDVVLDLARGDGGLARFLPSLEYRGIDAAANPYLAFSLLLAAGLKGIEQEYELPPEAEDDVWALSDAERRALGYHALPSSLDQAVQRMEESELVAETLGEQVVNYVLANEQRDFREYRAQVTPYELRTNLEIL